MAWWEAGHHVMWWEIWISKALSEKIKYGSCSLCPLPLDRSGLSNGFEQMQLSISNGCHQFLCNPNAFMCVIIVIVALARSPDFLIDTKFDALLARADWCRRKNTLTGRKTISPWRGKKRGPLTVKYIMRSLISHSCEVAILNSLRRRAQSRATAASLWTCAAACKQRTDYRGLIKRVANTAKFARWWTWGWDANAPLGRAPVLRPPLRHEEA